jgi:hypothetical protein
MNEDDRVIQATRSWTGLLVVLFGDAAICLVVILGVSASNVSGETSVAILTSAFTAVATMTTAYFGIRGMANTAQRSVEAASAQSTGAAQQATEQAAAVQAVAQQATQQAAAVQAVAQQATQQAAEQASASQQAAAEQATAAQQAADQAVAAQPEVPGDQLEDSVVDDDDVTHQDEDQDAEQLAGEDVEYDLGDDREGRA